MRSHYDVVQELREAGISPTLNGTFFHYDGLVLERYYDAFFRLAQDFLDREDLGLNVQPARIFFNSSTTINACAYFHTKGYYIIEINQGVIVNLFRRFYYADTIFNSPALVFFRDLALRFNQSPGFLIFQDTCLMFLYHEIGHLVQQSGQNAGLYQEHMAHICTGEEVKIRHIRELDADWFSANHIAHYILEAREREPKGVPLTTTEFEAFAAQILSSVYLYFISNCEGTEMYFEEQCHPHPAVRLAYYSFMALGTLENLLGRPLNKAGIHLNAKLIAETVLIGEGSQVVPFYNELIRQHWQSIQRYIRQVMTSANDYPFTTWRILSTDPLPVA